MNEYELEDIVIKKSEEQVCLQKNLRIVCWLKLASLLIPQFEEAFKVHRGVLICVHFVVVTSGDGGAPPVIVFSSACAGLAGGAVPAVAQLASSSYHAVVSSSSLPPPSSRDDK
ncbi:unnamed protein product, partial [Ilex paraguariensis]